MRNSEFGNKQKKEKQECGLRPIGAYAPEGMRKEKKRTEDGKQMEQAEQELHGT